MNINSLSYHFDDFQTLLSQLSVTFDITGITETRLKTYALKTSNFKNILLNTDQLNQYVVGLFLI